MKRYVALILVLAALILSSCATLASRSARRTPQEAPLPAMPETQRGLGTDNFLGAPQESFADAGKAAGGGVQLMPAATAAPSDPERLVIQNAELSIVVADVNARVQAIQTMAKDMGGFIVSVNVYQASVAAGEAIPQANIVVRVPQDKLEEAILQVKKDTVDVPTETRSGTDVTDQYVDLQSRLKAKQAAEEQLLKIMQEATKTQDVLDVYAQLQQVQSDIEVLKGQIKYYEQSAALSALSVTVIAEKSVQPIEIGGWKPQGEVRDAVQSLIYFWQDFVDFLIRFFLFILPVLLTVGIPLYLIFLLVRWIIRRNRKPRAVVPVEEQKK